MFNSLDHLYTFAINYLGATDEDIHLEIESRNELQILVTPKDIFVIFYCQIDGGEELREILTPEEYEELGNSEITDALHEHKDELFARNIKYFKLFIP